MPYYCTVPRCTSMAGKVKNVSFHQFPRDEELAKLWNNILKRGKPYTKYSKVCSLHFTPDDYTITNAGQWRTLRKDAIPSRNLPTEPPVPYHRRNSSSWSPVNNAIDPRLHQQMAQAIYVQTMLAMQAASVAEGTGMFNNDQQTSPNGDRSISPSSNELEQISYNYVHFDRVLNQRSNMETDNVDSNSDNTDVDNTENREVKPNFNAASNTNSSFVNRSKKTYKCNECSKCFKDPDVFFLHKRIHNKSPLKSVENENLDANNTVDTQETLKANPILANLLRSGVLQESDLGPTELDVSKALDSNVVSIESQIMTALAANMENYLRNLSTIMTSSALVNSRVATETAEDNNAEVLSDNNVDDIEPKCDEVEENNDDCDKKDFNNSQDSADLVIDEEKC